jgi:hypothetical protein
VTPEEIRSFIEDGFVRIDEAFSRSTAEAALRIFRDDLLRQGIDPEDAATWSAPVVRLGLYTQPDIVAAANSPKLVEAFDQLAGAGNWRACRAVGTVPVRFPSATDPGDTGWHIDVSYGGDAADFLSWRANVHSRGRALLMLMLFSDVSDQDAPTRIRAGSHRDIARALAPAGEQGLSLRELLPVFAGLPEHRQVLATGRAGTVYLCHPFLLHAAQPHAGTRPRFLAQPPVLPMVDHWLPDLRAASCPVATAIAAALR